jgi:hypothetical protein
MIILPIIGNALSALANPAPVNFAKSSNPVSSAIPLNTVTSESIVSSLSSSTPVSTIIPKTTVFESLLPNITRKYERYRAFGLEGISIARKGTMPVKDSVTGEFMGSVSTNHPNVISGRWIHTSKGRLIGEDEKANRPSQVGQGNNNYKEMTISMRNRVLKVVGES